MVLREDEFSLSVGLKKFTSSHSSVFGSNRDAGSVNRHIQSHSSVRNRSKRDGFLSAFLPRNGVLARTSVKPTNVVLRELEADA